MKINLLPKEFYPTHIRTVLRGFVVVNGLVIIGIGVLSLNEFLEQSNKRKEVVAIQDEIASVKANIGETNNAIQNIENYERLIDPETMKVKKEIIVEDYSYSEFLYTIGSLTPKKVKINSITYPNDYEITIVGQGEDYSDINEFYNNLLASKVFNTLSISGIEVIPIQEEGNKALKKAIKFSLFGSKTGVKEDEQQQSEQQSEQQREPQQQDTQPRE